MDGLPSPAGGRMTSAQREELIEQVKQQIAVATAQELLTVKYILYPQFAHKILKIFFGCLQKMSEKCFKKCISKPGSSLDSSEQVCCWKNMEDNLFNQSICN